MSEQTGSDPFTQGTGGPREHHQRRRCATVRAGAGLLHVGHDTDPCGGAPPSSP